MVENTSQRSELGRWGMESTMGPSLYCKGGHSQSCGIGFLGRHISFGGPYRIEPRYQQGLSCVRNISLWPMQPACHSNPYGMHS